MNISRLSTAGGAGFGSAGPVQQRKGEPQPVRFAKVEKSEKSARPEGDVAVRAREAAGAEQAEGAPRFAGSVPKRLGAIAQQLDQRISNLIAQNKLSDRQIEALESASQDFQRLMGRIGNANFGANGPQDAIHAALAQLQSQVGSILHPDTPTPAGTPRVPSAPVADSTPVVRDQGFDALA